MIQRLGSYAQRITWSLGKARARISDPYLLTVTKNSWLPSNLASSATRTFSSTQNLHSVENISRHVSKGGHEFDIIDHRYEYGNAIVYLRFRVISKY